MHRALCSAAMFFRRHDGLNSPAGAGAVRSARNRRHGLLPYRWAVVEITGKPVKEVTFTPGGVPAKVDPNGKYLVEQMYVQHLTPKNRKAPLPILMWHGGGLTGVTYETTPDGREGWQTYFVRKGWQTYVSDAVERGRSGWASPDVWSTEPVFLPIGNPWERFRIGDGAGSWNEDPAKRKQLAGSQFPAEGYENFVRQNVPRWTSTDAPIIAAYTALVDKVCPCVVLAHSQGGPFAQCRGPGAAGQGEGAGAGGACGPRRQGQGRCAEGYTDARRLWRLYRAGCALANDPQEPVGVQRPRYRGQWQVDVLNLPERGLKGNSHMLMMDKNNLAVADLILDWLKARGLMQ